MVMTSMGAAFHLAPQARAAVEPYGSCAEAWQAPRSAGADDCREMGWTVRPRLVVDPSKQVRYTRMPHCLFDDGTGGPCIWDGRLDGNGVGRSFWADKHERIHYVRL